MPSLSNMPGPLKVALGVATGGGILYAVTAIFPSAAAWIFLLGGLVVALLVGAYALLLKWMEKRRSRPLERGILAQGASAPVELSAPASRARLDDLRKSFTSGFTKLKAARKDWHTLPWYVIVGESGSGKTEAIRHCSVGFPPGLQDEFQGVGGTINMNWWFTNRAIILDTAGRIMFEEVEPGAPSEWVEFLRLLRRSRPNCPINGMFLVIPADSLIKDSADAIERKAGKIVRQLDRIQRELDIRFPVYVIVTKSDLINGFREFFDSIHDVQLQHQILGWSNPGALDDPLPLGGLEQELRAVVGRLNRRRMGLLLDPVPSSSGVETAAVVDVPARRTDEVDALYAFPQSLLGLMPRIRRYLEMIFGASEWSARPLFLRGIYFTSAMREGAALDADLAEALGVPVESLGEGKIWERERAFFLRDVMVSKAFPEHGLVTRARNAARQHRWRKAAVLITGFASVIVLALMTWLGARTLRQSVGVHQEYWQAAVQGRWDADNGTWEPIIAPEYEGGPWNQYCGLSPLTRPLAKTARGPVEREPVTLGGKPATLGQFHAELFTLSRQKIEVPWIFRLAQLSNDLDVRRREAFAVVFERGVLRPMFLESRKRMLRCVAPEAPVATLGPAPVAVLEQLDWSPNGSATAALESLIRAEAAGHARRPAETKDCLTSLARFVLPKDGFEQWTGQQAAIDTVLMELYAGSPNWPPADSLDLCSPQAHRAIQAGVEGFIRANSSTDLPSGDMLGKLQQLRRALLEFAQAEDRLLALPADFQDQHKKTTAETTAQFEWTSAQYEKRLAEVNAAAQAVALARAQVSRDENASILRLCQEHAALYKQSMAKAYQSLLDATGVRPSRPEPAPALPGALPVAASLPTAGPATQPVGPAGCVLGEAYARLSETRDRQTAQIDQNCQELASQLGSLEQEHLRLAGAAGLASYAQRCKDYERELELARQAQQAATAPVAAPTGGLVQAVRDLQDALRRVQPVEQPLASASGPSGQVRSYRARRLCWYVNEQILASRRRRLIADFLHHAPDGGEAWARAVAQHADIARLAPVSRPYIPLAGKQAESFDALYHPSALSSCLLAWRAVRMEERISTAAMAPDPSPPAEPALPGEPRPTRPTALVASALDRGDLIRQWAQRQQGLEAYLSAYANYWAAQVAIKPSGPAIAPREGQGPVGWQKVTAADWKAFNAGLRSTSVEQINISLEKLGLAVTSALAVAREAADLETAKRMGAVAAAIQSSLGSLRLDTFQVAADKAVRNWQGLSEDGDRARRALLAGRPADYAGPALLDKGYIGQYWKELNLTGMELLAASYQDAVVQAIKSLREQADGFPLAVPPRLETDRAKELSPEQVEAVRKLLAVLSADVRVTGRTESGLSIAEGAETVDAEINYQLRRLRGAALTDADREWVDRLRALAAVLPGPGERIKCTVSIPKQKDDSFSNWLLHVYLKQGRTVVGRERTAQLDGRLGQLDLPGEELRVEFFRHPDDKQPSRVVPVGGQWGALRLLHAAQVERAPGAGVPASAPAGGAIPAAAAFCAWECSERSADGKTWTICLTLRDDGNKPYSFYVQLTFDRAVPAVSSWPVPPGR